MKKQTAGREYLGGIAPQFAALNDDVLFGEVWAREKELSLRDRSMITIASLLTAGQYPQLKSHLALGKENGIRKEEVVEIITQLAFYCGWPKAWSAFPLIEEIYGEGPAITEERTAITEHKRIADRNPNSSSKRITAIPEHLAPFPLGEENTAYQDYFVGKSYLATLSLGQINAFHVTFTPGARNYWHVHRADRGGGQLLLCTYGRGWYQEWGKEERELHAGDTVFIPAHVKHWHGAASDSWFQHIAEELPGENSSVEWCEAVSDEDYNRLS